MELFHGRAGVCGPGSIVSVLISTVKDKSNILQHILVRKYGGFSGISPLHSSGSDLT